MSARSAAEVYVLPESLPPGYTYVSAESPTADSHATFVGAVVAADDSHTLRVSVRWRARPDASGAVEDGPAEPPASRIAGRDVYVYDLDRTARVPFTDETDVWLSFDTAVGELPTGLFESVVSSLVEVDEAVWRALLEGVGQPVLAFDDAAFAGLCEDLINDFAEGEPAPSTTKESAVQRFVAENRVLAGLVVEDGKILHRGEQVGSYRVVELPGDTFAVESAEWCYPGG